MQLDQINQTQLEMDREQKRMAKTMKDQTKGEEMLRQGAARQLSSLKGQVRGTVSGPAHSPHTCPRTSHVSPAPHAPAPPPRAPVFHYSMDDD